MTEPSYDEIDNDVDSALKSLIGDEFPTLDFSYSIVPSAHVNDGGLGATWNGWRGLLRRLQTDHLIPRVEYEEFFVGPLLIDHTFDKTLSSARVQIRNRLLLCVEHAFDPL